MFYFWFIDLMQLTADELGLTKLDSFSQQTQRIYWSDNLTQTIVKLVKEGRWFNT